MPEQLSMLIINQTVSSKAQRCDNKRVQGAIGCRSAIGGEIQGREALWPKKPSVQFVQLPDD